MTGHRIRIPHGFKLKDGKLVKSSQHLDVSARLRQVKSKRVRVVRSTPTGGQRPR